MMKERIRKIGKHLVKGMLIGGIGVASVVSGAETMADDVVQNKLDLPLQLGSIIKSERDMRHYQSLTLNNGMRVLLISDPQAIKSLAGVALPVGGMQDPSMQQGLAHYHEHMVLMGSKKYPQADNFSDYLSKNSGSYNASTSLSSTSYYLEVEHHALSGVVDRLAQALTAPLFDPINADRERNAVNAELTMARSSEGLRMLQIDAETINPAHPAAHFFGGNLETLSDKPESKLHDELLAFYQRYYSANIMVGLLYSNQSIEQLMALAAHSFGQIPNHQIEPPLVSEPVITDKQVGKIIHYVPAKTTYGLMLQFMLPYRPEEMNDKVDEYILYLLQNRDRGGLYDTLQARGWVENLSAMVVPTRFGQQGSFNINVTLTSQGQQNREQVVEAVFGYLRLIEQRGISSAYFNELQRVLQLAFLYPDQQYDMRYAQYLLGNLLIYPIAHVLDAPYRAVTFDPDAIKQRLAAMTVDHARIWYIGPNEPHNREAYFMQALYSVEDIPTALRQRWQKPDPLMALHLPKLNPYLPDNFQIVAPIFAQDAVPEQVAHLPTGRAFYRASHYFADEPKADVTIALRSPSALSTMDEQILFMLMDYLVNIDRDQLNYQSSIGGVNISTYPKAGLVINVSGFNQHIAAIVSATLAGYQQLLPDETAFEQAKEWYLKRLKQNEEVKAFEQAIQAVDGLRQIPYFERDARRQRLSTLSIADLLAYRDRLLKSAYIDMFVLGNMTKQQVSELLQATHNQLKNDGKVRWLGHQLQRKTPFKGDIRQASYSTDSSLFVGYVNNQLPRFTSEALSLVTAQILAPKFYQRLRTEQQLGYAVFHQSMSLVPYYGLVFLIQSNHADPAFLYQQYHAFFLDAKQVLTALSDDELAQYKQSITSYLEEAPQTLQQESQSYEIDFELGDDDFMYKQHLLAEVNAITKSQLVDFFDDTVIKQQGITLISQVLGKDAQTQQYHDVPSADRYSDASTLQKQFQWELK